MKLRCVYVTAVVAAFVGISSCNKGNGPVREAVSHKDVYQEAYVYAFPMIAAYKALYQFNVDKTNSQYKGPFNTIVNEARVFTYKDTGIVTPNSDTPYSLVQMDLRAEPIVLCVPKVEKARYYTFEIADQYSQNYAYIGSRATGNDPGCYMVSGPSWNGTTPDGIKKVFPSETQFSLAVIRTQLFNPNDMDNVKKIQPGYKVQTLSEFTHQPPPASLLVPDFPKFTDDAFKLQFPVYLNFLLQFCPTAPEEAALRARFATVGIEAGKPFDLAKLSEAQKGELGLAVKEGYEAIEKQKDSIGKDINGWNVGAAFGNRAFYNGNYLLRAGSALAGIYGNDAIEAMYPQAKAASDGQPLDASKHNYTLTFAAGQFPPVNAFWSVTMYDGKTQLLIRNPINRYLIHRCCRS
jgi:hypothetical protein